MPEKVIQAVGLDAGSSRTRCVVCALEDSRLRLLGCGEAQSRGWLKSRIADQAAVSASILEAVREAERCAGLSIHSLVVGIGGSTIRGANSRSSIELGRTRAIEQRDVNRVLERALRVQLHEDRMILQLFPQDFVVDGHPGLRDPRKMLAFDLEANAHLITGSIQEHNCLIGAVNQAALAVEETVYEPLAACYAAVLPNDRREGVALVDIGADSSDMVVYHGESLQLASTVAVGGDHFTRDIAQVVSIGFDDAQDIKEEYGSAVSASTAVNSVIEIPASGDRAYQEVPRRKVNEIVEARARELFKLVRRELARVGMDRTLIGGVVLTGSGARLNGLCDIAEVVLNWPARKGLPVGIRDWPDELNDPAWNTVAGLAMYSARLKLQSEKERKSVSVLGRMLR
jgi:cell division protein FtsA